MLQGRLVNRILCAIFILGTVFVLSVPYIQAAAEATADCVFIDSAHYYNPKTDCYVYIIEQLNNAEIYSSVADGMITNGPVDIEHQMMVSIEIVKDEEILDISDSVNLTEPGNYIVKAIGNDVSYEVFRFTIPHANTSLSTYKLPDGCRVTMATCNDVSIGSGGNIITFPEDGEYHIEYSDMYSEKSFMFDTVIDSVPPTLPLAGVTDGVASGSVSLLGGETGATIYVEQDGIKYTPKNNELTEAANYYVRVTDEAGNYSEYVFTINFHVDTITILFLLLVILVLAVLVFILLGERRKMRIR